MSTDALCRNQYHSRLWSSAVHADETGPSHEDEWVLATIHYERLSVRCERAAPATIPLCTTEGHKHGLTWDQARKVYLNQMGRVHCTYTPNDRNPETEGFPYATMTYSGIYHRVSMRHIADGGCNVA